MKIKLKLIRSILNGSAIVIQEDNEQLKVYVGDNNNQQIKRMASNFFKHAYKLI